MLLASDSNTLNDDYNVDDQLGDSIDIPTIILSKDVSDIIREHLISEKEDIIISIYFSGNALKNVEMNLFYRSDDLKVFSFFKTSLTLIESGKSPFIELINLYVEQS